MDQAPALAGFPARLLRSLAADFKLTNNILLATQFEEVCPTDYIKRKNR
jgi:hypothetical protein